ncbi:MAG: hypothetical protein HYW63_03920 [Candidatus Levybacteria bacterium]|nr:hypothetical protein [Candidatus Levybacteria bacterium]
MKISHKFLLLIVSVVISLVLVIPVSAQEDVSSPTPTKVRPQLIKDRIQEARQKNIEIRENLKARASEAAVRRAEKLSEARLRICEARQKGILQRIKLMLERGLIIHRGHLRIYERVDAYYNNKLVPDGHTLSNYSDLKAEIEANKANVQTLLDAAKASGGTFDCSLDDPLGEAQAFKDDIKALIEANREYKKSIHNFVKAVLGLAKEARGAKVSPTLTPVPTEGGEG